MRILRPKGEMINIDDKDRRLLFTINVIDELQETFNLPVSKIISKLFSDEEDDTLTSFALLRTILTVLINDDVELYNEENEEKRELVTEKYVGRKITYTNVAEVSLKVLNAYKRSLGILKDEEDDDSPNLKSVQSKN